jgi:hypothetical protein
MGRLVDPKPRNQSLLEAISGKDATKEAAIRIAKYVPAEVIVPYTAATAGIVGATAPQSMTRLVDLIVAFALGLIATPLYLNTRAEHGQPKVLHLIVATGSFAAWSYGTGGFWKDLGWFQVATAALVILGYSLLSGLAVPTEGTP